MKFENLGDYDPLRTKVPKFRKHHIKIVEVADHNLERIKQTLRINLQHCEHVRRNFSRLVDGGAVQKCVSLVDHMAFIGFCLVSGLPAP